MGSNVCAPAPAGDGRMKYPTRAEFLMNRSRPGFKIATNSTRLAHGGSLQLPPVDSHSPTRRSRLHGGFLPLERMLASARLKLFLSAIQALWSTEVAPITTLRSTISNGIYQTRLYGDLPKLSLTVVDAINGTTSENARWAYESPHTNWSCARRSVCQPPPRSPTAQDVALWVCRPRPLVPCCIRAPASTDRRP